MRHSKHKNILLAIAAVVLLGGAFMLYGLQKDDTAQAPVVTASDYKNIEYSIDGQNVMLKNGIAETDTGSNAESKTVTRYFGNEFVTDLNDDGRDDVVFLLTQETGGSGTFYYAVAALNTEDGYVGSDGYLLGDRVAPQTIGESPNPRHVNVVVVNYVDRAPGEPMTTQPSIGKSAYLKLDLERMQWGIVVPDFEGESAL
ncbi:MAG: hypothetical protein ACJKTH_03235 [Patescibacteria group bacterium UBA2163]